MRSPALVDFAVRLREAIRLVRLAQASTDPGIASACAKSATVLLSASLERYANDALDQACRNTTAEAWEQLPKGVQRFLLGQISRRLQEVSEAITAAKMVKDSHADRLREAVAAAQSAFRKPSSWDHLPEFGVFLEGAAAPDRFDALLRDFQPDGKGFFESLEERGLDRGALARSLSDLIDARHSVAHAKADRIAPSPSDAAAWAVVVFVLARGVHRYLAEAGS